jgi:Glycosyl hydrolases family 35/Beta-galactosidase jelly roll domain
MMRDNNKSNSDSAMATVSFDRHSLIIDGQPTIIRSAAIHYFRLPDETLWRDRLTKLKAAGYNTVDIYFMWGYHSPSPGVYDFTGPRNLKKLLQITQELGLWIIGRPGPYINAETAGGGLPLWLLEKPGIRLRHRNDAGGYEYCPTYGSAVQEWMTHVVPMVKDCPNLIAFQIENEYATSEMDPAPIRDLAKLARDLGVTVPLFHNDLYAFGLYADVLDLYAFDHYPVTDFEEDWRKRAEHVFSLIDNVENQIRPFCEQRPLMVAECQAGWFSGWNAPEELDMENIFGREFLPLITKTLLSQGVTFFNHYLGAGCTNWGSLGAIDSHTAYDFAAPIAESGECRESLYEAKALNQMLESFDLTRTDRVDSPVVNQPGNLPYWLCTRQAAGGGYWVFYRNLTSLPDVFTVRPQADWPDVAVNIASQEGLVLPLQVPLKATGWELLWSTTECVVQTERLLVVKADHDATVMLKGPLPDDLPEVDGVTQTRYQDGIILYCPGLVEEDDEEVRVSLGNLTVLFASQRLIDTLWIQGNGSLVMGPVAQLSDTEFAIMDPEEDLLLVSPGGKVARETGFTDVLPVHLPLLNHMRLCHGAPQLIDLNLIAEPYQPVCYQDGLCWYGRAAAPVPQSLTIQARHHWAVFVDGECIHSHFAVNDLLAVPDTVTVNIPDRFLSEKTLDVVLLTDSLGISKGFHDDPRQHQGLMVLTAHMAAGDTVDWLPQIRQTRDIGRWQPALKRLFGLMPDHSPIILAETHFALDDYSAFDWSLALEINDIPVERVDIYLNDVRVGRYRKHLNNQTRFQLPVGILKPDKGAQNHLELVFIQPYPLITFPQIEQYCRQDIHLLFASAFQKISL